MQNNLNQIKTINHIVEDYSTNLKINAKVKTSYWEMN